ncbi:MFS transporter [Sphingobium sp. TKS]|uniref:MFS transporter n=1 Tax=Sphingobium sp. TKS TaxID=1315974 RepID=UPI000770153D|nr:MFS transporter [Sphingobium sp. TKS]AMK26828.1 major facilitator superfamily protein [Sphingobium sp. TKS]
MDDSPAGTLAARTAAREHERPFGVRFVTPLALGAVLNPINSTAISIVIVPIARHYHASVADTGWLIGAIYLSSAVAQPVMGRMADVLGARRIYFISLFTVALASVVGMVAGSLLALIMARVALGVGTSGAYPAAMRIFRLRGDRLGTEPPRGALGILAFAAAATAIFGPALGGILSDAFGWRAIFALNLPFVLLIAILVIAWIPEYEPYVSARAGTLLRELDLIGIGLFSIFLIGFMLCLMGMGIWYALPVCIAALATLILHSLKRTQPFLDIRMLMRNRSLSLTYVRHLGFQIVIYSIFFGFPQWVEASAGYSPTEAGLITIPMYVLSALGALAGGRLRSLRAAFTLSAASALVGCILLFFLHAHSAGWIIACSVMFFGIPTGLTSVASQTAVYVQSETSEIGAASGFLRTAQYLGALTSTSLLSLAYGHEASDAGIQQLALILGVCTAVILVGTLIDRSLSRDNA